ncbi:sensor histidine kinase [Flagellimonas algicola]|uniref:GHKL domain-containing protein n=1 Tax=Flagellimonas algicola TaxID=2583815 RepID=A0ABY2WG51_9FLAO|nr:histidine kinase [Allomuricauda algicola]TMU50529.1 GHKL domain-containing protein [Allomuricauda algicola]
MIPRRELIFQVVLHILVFWFYTYDRRNPGIEGFQIAFFLNYTLWTILITYFLMPRYLYQKKHWKFFGGVLMVIVGTVMLQEGVLEPIFFAGTRRAQIIPGLYWSLFGVVPILAILSGFKFAWDALQKQKQIDELKSTVEESELQFLRSQINPHFLFNNLNNLYSYALENSPKTPEIILEMSGVLRYMLYECKERFVPLKKEIEQLDNFIKLYKLQIEDRGKVRFETHQINSGYKVAPLILIVFIENAFKHSQSGQSSNISIDINVSQKGNQLQFTCSNNFEDVKELDAVANGIGLSNVKKRLQLLYPNRHELEIRKESNQFSVLLTMELEKSE